MCSHAYGLWNDLWLSMCLLESVSGNTIGAISVGS